MVILKGQILDRHMGELPGACLYHRRIVQIPVSTNAAHCVQPCPLRLLHVDHRSNNSGKGIGIMFGRDSEVQAIEGEHDHVPTDLVHGQVNSPPPPYQVNP
jgi:hypothetical protein